MMMTLMKTSPLEPNISKRPHKLQQISPQISKYHHRKPLHELPKAPRPDQVQVINSKNLMNFGQLYQQIIKGFQVERLRSYLVMHITGQHYQKYGNFAIIPTKDT